MVVADIQGNRCSCSAEESRNGESQTGITVSSSSAVNHGWNCTYSAVSASSSLDHRRCQLLDTSGMKPNAIEMFSSWTVCCSTLPPCRRHFMSSDSAWRSASLGVPSRLVLMTLPAQLVVLGTQIDFYSLTYLLVDVCVIKNSELYKSAELQTFVR